MHVPDHLIDNRTELIAGLSAAAVVTSAAWGLRSAPAGRRIDRAIAVAPATLLRHPERFGAQMATAALVFALQMVNFPVLPGTSGHLLGGALAVALIGPRRALLAVGAVLATQAVVFADGGVGALGVNIWLIAILPVTVAAVTERVLVHGQVAGPGRRYGVAGLAAFAAPPIAALGLVGFLAIGGTNTGSSLGETARSMLGVHLAIGVGEAVLSVGVLAATARIAERHRQVDVAPVWGTALLAAAGLSMVASSAPDGLERVSLDMGFAATGPSSLLSAGPLAGYTVRGLDGALATSLAGLVGVAATCAVAAVLLSAAGAPGRTPVATVSRPPTR